jgi:hypothetical protein
VELRQAELKARTGKSSEDDKQQSGDDDLADLPRQQRVQWMLADLSAREEAIAAGQRDLADREERLDAMRRTALDEALKGLDLIKHEVAIMEATRISRVTAFGGIIICVLAAAVGAYAWAVQVWSLLASLALVTAVLLGLAIALYGQARARDQKPGKDELRNAARAHPERLSASQGGNNHKDC